MLLKPKTTMPQNYRVRIQEQGKKPRMASLFSIRWIDVWRGRGPEQKAGEDKKASTVHIFTPLLADKARDSEHFWCVRFQQLHYIQNYWEKRYQMNLTKECLKSPIGLGICESHMNRSMSRVNPNPITSLTCSLVHPSHPLPLNTLEDNAPVNYSER